MSPYSDLPWHYLDDLDDELWAERTLGPGHAAAALRWYFEVV